MSYYVYGEGSVTHGDEPCPEGIGLHHPVIEREEWPSRRAYWRAEFRTWWFHREMRRMRVIDGQLVTRKSPLDTLVNRLFGPVFPRQPKVWAALRPEESIYPRAVEEAAWWAERRAARNEVEA